MCAPSNATRASRLGTCFLVPTLTKEKGNRVGEEAGGWPRIVERPTDFSIGATARHVLSTIRGPGSQQNFSGQTADLPHQFIPSSYPFQAREILASTFDGTDSPDVAWALHQFGTLHPLMAQELVDCSDSQRPIRRECCAVLHRPRASSCRLQSIAKEALLAVLAGSSRCLPEPRWLEYRAAGSRMLPGVTQKTLFCPSAPSHYVQVEVLVVASKPQQSMGVSMDVADRLDLHMARVPRGFGV